MRIINNELLFSLCEQAKENSVQRAKYCFQGSDERESMRSINVMDRGCVIPIEKREDGVLTLMILKGKLKVNLYNSDKSLTDEVFLDPKVGSYGIEIKQSVWHNLEVLDDNTVLFEISSK